MKQHITRTQLRGLKEKSFKKWVLYWLDNDRLFLNDGKKCEECERPNLPNIGEMIQFLNDKDPDGFDLGIKNPNLCDALWDDCEEILNK